MRLSDFSDFTENSRETEGLVGLKSQIYLGDPLRECRLPLWYIFQIMAKKFVFHKILLGIRLTLMKRLARRSEFKTTPGLRKCFNRSYYLLTQKNSDAQCLYRILNLQKLS